MIYGDYYKRNTKCFHIIYFMIKISSLIHDSCVIYWFLGLFLLFSVFVFFSFFLFFERDFFCPCWLSIPLKICVASGEPCVYIKIRYSGGKKIKVQKNRSNYFVSKEVSTHLKRKKKKERNKHDSNSHDVMSRTIADWVSNINTLKYLTS